MVLNMQTFYEKVLETEGITKEMIDRQRGQAELLNNLLRADKEVTAYLLKEHAADIDETFFAMLQSYLDAAQQTGNDAQLVKITNLRARLMTSTPAGRQMEQKQLAMHAFSRDAKKAGGLSPELLLQHIIKNLDDEGVVGALIGAGQEAITYDFFTLLTSEIEAAEAAEAHEKATRLSEVRADLLQLQAEMRQQSQKLVDGALQTLRMILQAPDRQTAVRQHIDKIDDTFMYVLSSNIAQADQQGSEDQLRALSEVQSIIVREIESQYPPEVIFLNQLMEADSEQTQKQLLDENRALVQPQLVQMLEALEKQVAEMGQTDLNQRLNTVKALIQAQL
jgi:hypothetical protein